MANNDDWEDVPLEASVADDWEDVPIQLPRPKTAIGDSLIRGGAQGITAGFADEITAGLGAAYDYATGPLDLDIAYEGRRNAIRAADKLAQEDNPLAYGGAQVTGAIGSSAVPGLSVLNPATKATALGRVGTAAAGGGLVGAGTSEADLLEGDFGGLAKDVAVGAGTGAVAQGVLDKAAPVVSKTFGKAGELADDIGGKTKRVAERQAFKASIGNQAGPFDDAVKQGVVNQRGRDLLDDGVVTFGTNAREISKRAETARKAVGDKMDALFSQIDEAAPEGIVDSRKAAARLRAYADEVGGTGNKALTSRIEAAADELEQLGTMTMSAAQKEKNSWRYSPGDVISVPKEVANKVKSIIGSEMDEGVEAYAQRVRPVAAADESFAEVLQTGSGRSVPSPQLGQNPVLREAQSAGDQLAPAQANELYGHLKQKYGTMASTTKNAEKLANRQEKNRLFSLTDYMAGGAGFIGGGANPVTALAAAQGNKMLRERGPSATAVGLDKIGDMLQSSPEAFGKFAAPLQEAAKRGNHALAVTHFLMSQQDEGYRQTLDSLNEK